MIIIKFILIAISLRKLRRFYSYLSSLLVLIICNKIIYKFFLLLLIIIKKNCQSFIFEGNILFHYY